MLQEVYGMDEKMINIESNYKKNKSEKDNNIEILRAGPWRSKKVLV